MTLYQVCIQTFNYETSVYLLNHHHNYVYVTPKPRISGVQPELRSGAWQSVQPRAGLHHQALGGEATIYIVNCDHGDANKIYNHDVKNSHDTAAKIDHVK